MKLVYGYEIKEHYFVRQLYNFKQFVKSQIECLILCLILKLLISSPEPKDHRHSITGILHLKWNTVFRF